MTDSPASGTEPATTRNSQRAIRTIGYYAAILSLGLAVAVLGPTLPGLARQTQSDASDIGLVFTACFLGYLVGSLWGGRCYDRWPGHRVLAAGLLLLAGMLALTPWASQLWSLAAVLLLLGVAQGVVDVGGNMLVVWAHCDHVGPWMNGLHLCFGIGTVLAPLVVAQTVSPDGDVSWAYGLLAVLVLPGVAWLAWLRSPRLPITTHPTHQGEIPRWLVFLIALFLGLYVGAEIGFGGWICSYAVTLNLTSARDAAYLTSAFWGAFTFGRLVAIPLAVWFRPALILFCDLVGCLVSLGFLVAWPHSTVILWLGTVGLGLSMASVFPTMFSWAERRLAITGQVTAWFIVGGAAGSMALPWLMGHLFESLGPVAVMGALLIDLLLALGVLAGLMLRPVGSAGSQRR